MLQPQYETFLNINILSSIRTFLPSCFCVLCFPVPLTILYFIMQRPSTEKQKAHYDNEPESHAGIIKEYMSSQQTAMYSKN